jgi:hypothetical protein
VPCTVWACMHATPAGMAACSRRVRASFQLPHPLALILMNEDFSPLSSTSTVSPSAISRLSIAETDDMCACEGRRRDEKERKGGPGISP